MCSVLCFFLLTHQIQSYDILLLEIDANCSVVPSGHVI